MPVTNGHCIHWGCEVPLAFFERGENQIEWKKGQAWSVRWVLLCGNLHNYVLSQNDDWYSDDLAMDNMDGKVLIELTNKEVNPKPLNERDADPQRA